MGFLLVSVRINSATIVATRRVAGCTGSQYRTKGKPGDLRAVSKITNDRRSRNTANLPNPQRAERNTAAVSRISVAIIERAGNYHSVVDKPLVYLLRNRVFSVFFSRLPHGHRGFEYFRYALGLGAFEGSGKLLGGRRAGFAPVRVGFWAMGLWPCRFLEWRWVCRGRLGLGWWHFLLGDFGILGVASAQGHAVPQRRVGGWPRFAAQILTNDDQPLCAFQLSALLCPPQGLVNQGSIAQLSGLGFGNSR